MAILNRRRIVFLACLGLSAAVSSGLAVGSSTGQAGLAAASAALRDPLAVLAGRSPGARSGDLFQTKAGLVADPASRKPSERVLPTSRSRTVPPDPAGEFLTPGHGADQAPLGSGVAPAVPGEVLPGIVPIPVAGGGSSGGGFVPVTPIVPVTPPIIPSAVPEPSTWLMMVLGIGMIGAALRRRDRLALQAPAA